MDDVVSDGVNAGGTAEESVGKGGVVAQKHPRKFILQTDKCNLHA